jgi:NOL1/NOP2/sun family putative RNA methylase
MNLDPLFLDNMKKFLPYEEYNRFIESYSDNRLFGLRVNKLKISVDEFLKIAPFNLERVPWTDDGFYYDKEDIITKHPYYYAGLYYVQEPSAMAPGALLEAMPGDRVLDLCAAPGGKTTQIASHMKNEGIIFSNDISFERTKAIIKNIELYGIKNAIIINEDQNKISDVIKSYFNKVLVDAPCSGEGMFRKDKKMIKEWSLENVESYVKMQEDILDKVDNLLLPGGYLTYSTCTFNHLENENQIVRLMNSNSEFELVDNNKIDYGFRRGEILKETSYLMPHLIKGEGHFVSKLHKKGNSGLSIEKCESSPPEEFIKFMDENMRVKIKGYYRMFKNKLYISINIPKEFEKLNIIRNGWYLGDIKNGRFEPSQAFAMGLKKEDFIRTIDLSSDSLDVRKYLKGESIFYDGENGFNLVLVDSYPLGFGKLINGVLKNKYPTSWRML